MKTRLNSFLFVLLFAFALTAQAAGKAMGEVQLFAFQEGLPQAGVEVYSKGKMLGRTDTDGSLVIRLPAGKQKVQLRKAGKGITDLTLNVEKGEEIELLIPLTQEATVEKIIAESNQEETLKAPEEEQVAKAEVKEKPKAEAILEGQVTSLETRAGVPNVSIYLAGVSEKIKTDANGYFKATVPAGDYTLSAVHGDYSSQTIKRLKLAKDTKVTQNIELTPAAEQLEEFVVTAPALEGGVLAMMDQKRKSSAVTEVLSSEEMSSAGDSTAGDALKRVTGITYVGGKYVYVRGMGDRYSSTLLNKAGLPSPEPTKRVVPLDLFPTSMIGSITVQKSYSADLPGDFGGGAVLLKTKTIPEERKQKIKFALGGNTQSTGKEGLSYKGGATDFLGIDDGTRAIPSQVKDFLDNPPGRFDADKDQRIEAAGKSLPNIYDVTRHTVTPDMGFQVDLADINEQYGRNWSWGYNVSFGYKRKTRLRTEYGEDNDNKDATIQDVENKKEKSRQAIDVAGMVNLMLEVGDYDKVDSTTIISRKTTDTVTIADKFDDESTSNFKNYSLSWEERQLISQQFHGKHIFPDAEDFEVEWQTTFSNAQRKAPDTRFYQYAQNADTTTGQDNPYLFQTVGQSNSRVWEELSDNTISASVDFRKPLYDFLGSMGSWDNGLALDRKDRTSEVYRTRWNIPSSSQADLSNPNPETFLNDQFIGSGNGKIALQDYTNASDSYKANQQIQALYSKWTAKWESGLSLMAGARYESSSQEVETVLSEASGETKKNTLDKSFVLPSLSLGYAINKSLGQVRFAMAQTVNRPDLKELSEARYFNPEDDNYYKGNPDLKIAQITHYDLRWEKYLTSFENVSVALFRKEFTDPIELTQEQGGGTVDSFTYNNVSRATNQGLELQGRIWLRRLFGNWMSPFYFDTNATFIQSEIDLSNAPNYAGTNKKRALQGQSPWVFNANLGYENLVDEIKANLILNVAGPSIAEVGMDGVDDTYLENPVSLNFVYNQLLYQGYENKWKLKVKVNNLLDGEFKEVVGEGGDTIKKRYKKGTSFSAEVSYSWK